MHHPAEKQTDKNKPAKQMDGGERLEQITQPTQKSKRARDYSLYIREHSDIHIHIHTCTHTEYTYFQSVNLSLTHTV